MVWVFTEQLEKSQKHEEGEEEMEPEEMQGAVSIEVRVPSDETSTVQEGSQILAGYIVEFNLIEFIDELK